METPLLDEAPGAQLEGGALFERGLLVLKRHRRVWLAGWALVLAVSAVVGPRFTELGSDKLEPPPDSLAWRAQRQLEARFEARANLLPVILLVECKAGSGCTDVRTPELGQFYRGVEAFVAEFNASKHNVHDVMSWYKYNGTALDQLKAGFVSGSGQDTFINVMVNAQNDTNVRHEFIDKLGEVAERLNPAPAQFAIGVTGYDAINNANVNSARDQIMRVDAVTVPIAICILAVMIGSWRLMVLAGISMVVSVLTSFAIMTVLVSGLGAPAPEATTAQLMEVICLALTIDYSLFLLRRFRDELQGGASPACAVYIMMLRAGHVVLMSGTTLLFVMLAFLLIPCTTIRMDGVSCAVGVAVCVAVNLTLTPTLLYAFPAFFSRVGPPQMPWRKRVDPDQSLAGDSLDTSVENGFVAFGELSDDAPQGIHPMYKTWRFRLTRFVTRYPQNLISIVLLYVMVIPLALQIRHIELDQNILHLMPRGAPTTERLHRMYAEFPGGTFAPFNVLLNLPKDAPKNAVLKREVFTLAQHVSADIVGENGFEASSTSSPAWLAGTNVAAAEAAVLLFTARSDACQLPFVRKEFPRSCQRALQYQFLWDNSVNEQGNAMLINIVVPFFPFDKRSKSFIHTVNDILARHARDFNAAHPDLPVELFLTGFEVGPEAIEEAVFAVFPYMVLATIASIFLVLGFMLRSYFVPVRLALTLFLPLASVFGLAVLVYQGGIFNWTGLKSISSSGGFFWSVPIMILTMIAGLVLDYDLFLITRIMEHRASGYEIQAATVKAVSETGPTITAAGCIMVVCFCGMLLSDQTLIDQSGWLLSSSVLVDVFVVNTVLVPALVSLGDKVAWQPTAMPMNNLITLDAPEFTEHPAASG